MCLYKFQLKLVGQLCSNEELIAEQSESSSDENDVLLPPAKSPRLDPASRLRGGFANLAMEYYPPTEKTKVMQRECRVCSKKNSRKRTRFYCKQCNVPLCAAPCFSKYRTAKCQRLAKAIQLLSQERIISDSTSLTKGLEGVR